MTQVAEYLVLELTEQHERYILSGYAAFIDEDLIYKEFCAAFPESIDHFAEEHGERESREALRRSISHLSPSHPKFPSNRLKIHFDALRREFLNQQEDAFMGHSRNRLEVLNDVRKQLLMYASSMKEDTTDFLGTMRLIIETAREARSESVAFQRLSETDRFSVSPEEIASMLSKLPLETRNTYMELYKAGEHPEVIINKLQMEVRDLTKDEKDTHDASDKKVLPAPEDTEGGQNGADETQSGAIGDTQSSDLSTADAEDAEA